MPVFADPSARLLRLHEADNVLTALAPIESGRELQIEGEAVTVGRQIPLGHKLAARPIAPNEKVLKYGVPIGSAICRIARGDHVHTHNVRSDYLPTPGSELRDLRISGSREFVSGLPGDFGNPEILKSRDPGILQIPESRNPEIPECFSGYLRPDGRKGI